MYSYFIETRKRKRKINKKTDKHIHTFTSYLEIFFKKNNNKLKQIFHYSEDLIILNKAKAY